MLGIADKSLAGSIKEIFPNVACETGDINQAVGALLRGLRQHAPKLLKQLQAMSTVLSDIRHAS